jgi:hypothetical protein
MTMYPSDFSEWLDAVDGDYNEMMENNFGDSDEPGVDNG